MTVRGITPSVSPVGLTPGRARDEAALKKSAEALEGLFVQQLFQAMRASVPTDGLLERGPGEDLFGSMLDQRIAEEVATQDGGARDLSLSLFEALRDRLGPPADTGR
jgi:hypothetical protein